MVLTLHAPRTQQWVVDRSHLAVKMATLRHHGQHPLWAGIDADFTTRTQRLIDNYRIDFFEDKPSHPPISHEPDPLSGAEFAKNEYSNYTKRVVPIWS